ncbi:MAG: ATP-binding protein [Candidatus Eremiobacteraeota bacterium]|nr:ATP-binding protein [Candidatus Eremiobacteraeota bacterium]
MKDEKVQALQEKVRSLMAANKALLKEKEKIDRLLADSKDQKECEGRLNQALARANAESAELLAELEEKNRNLEDTNVQIARANAHAAELMALIELRDEQITELNKALSMANVNAAELLAELEIHHAEQDRLNAQLQVEKERLHTTLASIGDGVVTTDTEGKVILFNAAAQSITEWPPDEIAGHPLTSVLDFRDASDNVLRDARDPIRISLREKKGIFVDEAWILTKSGLRRPVEINISLICTSAGEILGTVAAFRDRTRHKELERLKEEFIASMTHDLRTPLSSIMGFCQLLGDSDFGEISAKKNEFVNRIHHCGDILLGIINNIVELSRIESGMLHFLFEDFTLCSLIKELYDTFEPLAIEMKIALDFQCDSSLWVNADRQLTRQVFHNLLSNAIRATPQGGTISINVALCGNERIAVEVKDTGKGIPGNELPKLFKKFARISGSRRGTGLGLFNVKKFVEGHGSDITVESEPGAGTLFRFTLPQGHPPAKEVLKKGSVLIVGGDIESGRLAALSLQEEGHRAEFVAGGKEGIMKTIEIKPHVVLLDRTLPDMEVETFHYIFRNTPTSRDVPLILLSSVRLSEWKDKFFDIIPLPLDMKVMKRAVQKALKPH